MERRYAGRRFVSRNQWVRYMMKLVGPTWRQRHWLWWAKRLAQFFILTISHRIETEKACWIRHAQANLKEALPQTLIDHYEKKLKNYLRNRPEQGKKIMMIQKQIYFKIIINTYIFNI